MNDYPRTPGYTEPTTSRDAADRMRRRAPSLRAEVLRTIKEAGANGLTSDEVAERLGKTGFAVRPRLTELSYDGSIRKTSRRRPNASGAGATVWVARI